MAAIQQEISLAVDCKLHKFQRPADTKHVFLEVHRTSECPCVRVCWFAPWPGFKGNVREAKGIIMCHMFWKCVTVIACQVKFDRV